MFLQRKLLTKLFNLLTKVTFLYIDILMVTETEDVFALLVGLDLPRQGNKGAMARIARARY